VEVHSDGLCVQASSVSDPTDHILCLPYEISGTLSYLISKMCFVIYVLCSCSRASVIESVLLRSDTVWLCARTVSRK